MRYLDLNTYRESCPRHGEVLLATLILNSIKQELRMVGWTHGYMGIKTLDALGEVQDDRRSSSESTPGTSPFDRIDWEELTKAADWYASVDWSNEPRKRFAVLLGHELALIIRVERNDGGLDTNLVFEWDYSNAIRSAINAISLASEIVQNDARRLRTISKMRLTLLAVVLLLIVSFCTVALIALMATFFKLNRNAG